MESPLQCHHMRWVKLKYEPVGPNVSDFHPFQSD